MTNADRRLPTLLPASCLFQACGHPGRIPEGSSRPLAAGVQRLSQAFLRNGCISQVPCTLPATEQKSQHSPGNHHRNPLHKGHVTLGPTETESGGKPGAAKPGTAVARSAREEDLGGFPLARPSLPGSPKPSLKEASRVLAVWMKHPPPAGHFRGAGLAGAGNAPLEPALRAVTGRRRPWAPQRP